MPLFATLLPLLCYLAYNATVPFAERRWPSLSVIMSQQRRRWVANATRRESPFDAILSGNLMSSVSFLASTAVLLVLAVFTVFSQLPAFMQSLNAIPVSTGHTIVDVQVHLVTMLALFVLAFFAFTLSLRQFNHFCIMLGAIDHSSPVSEEEIDAMARLNTLAAKSFNSGIRAFYFCVPMVGWFAYDWLAIVLALIITGFIVFREFFSTAHRLAAAAALGAARRDEARQPR